VKTKSLSLLHLPGHIWYTENPNSRVKVSAQKHGG